MASSQVVSDTSDDLRCTRYPMMEEEPSEAGAVHDKIARPEGSEGSQYTNDCTVKRCTVVYIM